MGSGQGLQRALILLALASSIACKSIEREPAGDAPPFHDQHLYAGMIIPEPPFDEQPEAIWIDVQRDVIHVGNHDYHHSFPRAHGATEYETRFDGKLLTVRNDDDVMVWTTSKGRLRQVWAANTKDVEHAWRVLEFEHDDAPAGPLVVGDRVAVLSECCIVHAPIQGGPPGVLALTQKPVTLPTSDGRRMVWIALQGERALVMSIDARFEIAEVAWDQPSASGWLRLAAPVGDSVVFITASNSWGVNEDRVTRVRADGSLVELFVRESAGSDLRLLPDGQQAWLYASGHVWWIGEHSHAFVRKLDAQVSAIAADDGLLLWEQHDGIHVAGQPEIEFEKPFAVGVAIGGDDADVWGGPVGNEIGEAYGVGGLHLVEPK